MKYKVILTAESENDLDRIYDYIEQKGFPNNALSFTESIVRFCMSLGIAPNRGTKHFEVRAGLRSIGFHRSVVIIFRVDERTKQVSIARILHGGQDLHRALNELR